MKIKIEKIYKLIRNRRLTKTHVDLMGPEYSMGYTDAINDILTEIHRINLTK